MKKTIRKIACVLALALAMVSVFGVAFADESKTYNIGIIQLVQHPRWTRPPRALRPR